MKKKNDTRKSFMEKVEQYQRLQQPKVVVKNNIEVKKEETQKTTKKEEKGMKKNATTTKELKQSKGTTKEMKETSKETKKETLTQRIEKLESFCESQIKFNDKLVNSLTKKFEKLDSKLDSLLVETKKETNKKETKTTQTKKTKKETNKKETTTKATKNMISSLPFEASKDAIKESLNKDERDLYLLKQKATHDIKNCDYSTISKIFAYCFYTLKDNNEKIDSYINYWTKQAQKTKNKDNKKLTIKETQDRIARVLVAQFYKNNKVGNFMKMYA